MPRVGRASTCASCIPSTPGLFAAGLVQANGSMWRIADYQGQLIANLIVAAGEGAGVRRPLPRRHGQRAANVRRGTFLASDRHRLEANYYDYRRLLKRHIRRFGPVRKMRLDPASTGRAPESVVRHREPAEEMAG